MCFRMTVHGHSIQTMTAAWLLPIVSTIVAAATGSLVAGILPDAEYALLTLLTSYVLWGTGVPLAMVVLVIYFLRLTTSNLPPKAVVVSTFLPLGPLGQGGFGIMQLGKVALEVFPKTHTIPAALHASWTTESGISVCHETSSLYGASSASSFSIRSCSAALRRRWCLLRRRRRSGDEVVMAVRLNCWLSGRSPRRTLKRIVP